MMSALKTQTPDQSDIDDDAQLTTVAKQVRQQKRRHIEILTISSCLLLILLLLSTDSERVSMSWSPDFSIPELCMSRTWFGINCPGCGLTRSFIALRNGHFIEAWQYHRLGWLMFLLVAAQIPYRIYALRSQEKIPSHSQSPNWIAYFVISALAINWLLDISKHFSHLM